MEHKISKTMYVIANFHNDKEVKKEYAILGENEH